MTAMTERFTRKISDFAAREELWQAGDRILVACSGGPDSLALAYWFATIRNERNLQIGIAYVHHHLRAAADDEVVFVRNFAAREGLPFYSLSTDIPSVAQTTGESIETAARRMRYQLLYEVVTEEKYDLLAVAHHRDDQAETVLHHILRGTGLQGLRGMLPQSGRVIRPLLCVTRAEIEAYLKTVPYEPRIDESNADTKYLRNALRHHLLPVLREYNPQIDRALCRLADTARADVEYLAEKAKTDINAYAKRTPEGAWRLSRAVYEKWPLALQRYYIRFIYRSLVDVTPDYETVENIHALIRRGKTGTEYSSRGVDILLTATDILGLVPAMRKKVSTEAESFPDENGYMQLGGYRIRAKEVATSQVPALPIDALQGRLRLRYRRPGDRINIRGVGTKKWKDWLIDCKIPRHRRDEIVLLADDKNVYIAFDHITANWPQGSGPYIIIERTGGQRDGQGD